VLRQVSQTPPEEQGKEQMVELFRGLDTLSFLLEFMWRLWTREECRKRLWGMMRAPSSATAYR
jgi:hypothetical protein